MKKGLSTKLLHCFGSGREQGISAKTAANMILASGIKEIAINTHNIDEVDDWKDLKIGYGDATWNTVSNYIDLSAYTPLWNINLPQSADEAIKRAEKVIKLGGNYPIKFEVLDSTLTWSNNKEVIKAVKYLTQVKNYQVWPLIAPCYEDFIELQKMNCSVIRIMGSPIGSNKGILSKHENEIKRILNNKVCNVMLDGGVNSIETINKAFSLGFDHILVNSWIFKDGNDPVEMLKKIKNEIK